MRIYAKIDSSILKIQIKIRQTRHPDDLLKRAKVGSADPCRLGKFNQGDSLRPKLLAKVPDAIKSKKKIQKNHQIVF